jgi:3',5'-nucleoside bisphosphate phosphatase
MLAYVDLHIHSALSPCSEKEMTPNNIVNMAYLKGLDIIAVTDHNSAENLAAVMKCAKQAGIIAVPGMEVETSEEVHVLCLLPDLEAALELQSIVYALLPDIKNREAIFGEQLILDEEDRIMGHCDRLLLTAAGLSLEEVFEAVEGLGGVAIPAHADRDSYSVLSNLGIIPEELNVKTVEISRECNMDEFISTRLWMKGYRWIRSSDAHRLGDILEKESSLELEDISVESLLRALDS